VAVVAAGGGLLVDDAADLDEGRGARLAEQAVRLAERLLQDCAVILPCEVCFSASD
jgi:hypothetical protein